MQNLLPQILAQLEHRTITKLPEQSQLFYTNRALPIPEKFYCINSTAWEQEESDNDLEPNLGHILLSRDSSCQSTTEKLSIFSEIQYNQPITCKFGIRINKSFLKEIENFKDRSATGTCWKVILGEFRRYLRSKCSKVIV